jgi:hypothetical protein
MVDPNSASEVIAHYEAGVKHSLLLEYRCREKGCLLLHVWQSPNGPEFLAPGHRLSGRYRFARELEQMAFAEMAGQGGGWIGRLDDYPIPWAQWVPLTCGHVELTALMSEIRGDLAVHPGRPRPILWPRNTPGHE